MRKVSFGYLAALLLAVILMAGAPQIAAQKKGALRSRKVTGLQKKQIESIIREYLFKNPSILREVNQALIAREEQEKQLLAATNLKLLGSKVFTDPNTPVGGNPKGDITVAVFFDYNCGYCKRTLPHLASLIERDHEVRIVYKEFPILSPQSQMAARAALAAGRQGKYLEFHKALVEAGEINEDSIKALAATTRLDYSRLQKDMADPSIDAELIQTAGLANSLGIDGTPAYVIGTRVVPGAVELNALVKLIEEERAKAKATAKK